LASGADLVDFMNNLCRSGPWHGTHRRCSKEVNKPIVRDGNSNLRGDRAAPARIPAGCDAFVNACPVLLVACVRPALLGALEVLRQQVQFHRLAREAGGLT